jgi:hypothetical protein
MHYIIYKTFTPSGKYYIGRHSTNNLDDGYIGSGKWVRSIKDRSSLTREILAFADSESELKILEEQFISKSLNDPNNMNFNDRSVGWPTGDLNWARSTEAKLLKSKRKKGLTLEAEYGIEKAKLIRQKISDSKTGKKTNKPAWNRGISPSTETKHQISKSISDQMNALTADERKEKFGNLGDKNGFFNKTHSSSTINILREKQKLNRQQNRLTCPYCSKNVDKPNYSRHHGNKCKIKDYNLQDPHSSI